MSMLGPVIRTSAFRSASKLTSASRQSAAGAARAGFATQSGDDVHRPTAVAKLHLEDGTTLIGRSFGSHEAVEGEVSAELESLLYALDLATCLSPC
jgi:hypothetical protein